MHPQFLPAPRSAIYEVLQNFSQDAHVSTHLSFLVLQNRSLPSLIPREELQISSRDFASRLFTCSNSIHSRTERNWQFSRQWRHVNCQKFMYIPARNSHVKRYHFRLIPNVHTIGRWWKKTMWNCRENPGKNHATVPLAFLAISSRLLRDHFFFQLSYEGEIETERPAMGWPWAMGSIRFVEKIKLLPCSSYNSINPIVIRLAL